MVRQDGPVSSTKPDRAAASGDAYDQRALAVLRQLRDIFAATQEHHAVLERQAGVSGSQLWALSEIARHPGIRMSDLGRTMALHPSTTSNLIDKIEARGLVRRTRSRRDHRVVMLNATQPGRELLERAPHPARGVLPDALERMDAGQLAHLAEALAPLLAVMGSGRAGR